MAGGVAPADFVENVVTQAPEFKLNAKALERLRVLQQLRPDKGELRRFVGTLVQADMNPAVGHHHIRVLPDIGRVGLRKAQSGIELER